MRIYVNLGPLTPSLWPPLQVSIGVPCKKYSNICGTHFTGNTLRNHPILKQALTVWQRVRILYYSDGVDAHTPLWHCTRLPELINLSHDLSWSANGIWHLSQICSESGIKPFPELQSEFNLPSSQLFIYLRVKHAFLAQFGHHGVTLQDFPIPSLLLSPLPRHMISILYSRLLGQNTKSMLSTLKTRWENDVGPLSDEEWNRAISSPQSISSNHNERLIQLYMVHRAYYTTTRLSRFRPGYVDICPKCLLSPGTFLHLLWSCPRVNGFWVQVIQFLHDKMGSPIQLCPKECILLPDPESFESRYSYSFCIESIFYAKKIIARTWLSHRSPSFPEWLNAVNCVLPLKKWIYQHRGCPTKFTKIWERWVQSELTVGLSQDSSYDAPVSP